MRDIESSSAAVQRVSGGTVRAAASTVSFTRPSITIRPRSFPVHRSRSSAFATDGTSSGAPRSVPAIGRLHALGSALRRR